MFTNSIEEIIIDVRTLFQVYFPIIIKVSNLPIILFLYFTQCISSISDLLHNPSILILNLEKQTPKLSLYIFSLIFLPPPSQKETCYKWIFSLNHISFYNHFEKLSFLWVFIIRFFREEGNFWPF